MSKSPRIHDLQGVSNGLVLVFKSYFNSQTKQIDHYVRSFVVPDVEYFKMQLENQVGKTLAKSPTENIQEVGKKFETIFGQTKTFLKSDLFNKYFGTQHRNMITLNSKLLQNAQIYHIGLGNTNHRHYSSTTDFVANKTVDSKETIKKSTLNVAKFRQQVLTAMRILNLYKSLKIES